MEDVNTYLTGRKYLLERLPSSFEADQLFEFVTGMERGQLLLKGDLVLEESQWETLKQVAQRRQRGEPLQYILGQWEFYSLPFYVGPGVLIPRPETELLVEGALERLLGVEEASVLDLCAGSGCVAISIEKNATCQVVGVEKSVEAFGYFQQNIKLNNSGVTGVLGDIFTYNPKEKVDIIVSNPPYIPESHLKELQVEVRQEPSVALDGGSTGLDFYRFIPYAYKGHLKPHGWLGVEIGIDQQDSVVTYFKEAGYKQLGVLKDLRGIPRVVWGQN